MSLKYDAPQEFPETVSRWQELRAKLFSLAAPLCYNKSYNSDSSGLFQCVVIFPLWFHCKIVSSSKLDFQKQKKPLHSSAQEAQTPNIHMLQSPLYVAHKGLPLVDSVVLK